MKVTLNPTTCIASANCSHTASRVFSNLDENDGFARVIDEYPPESEWAAVREAENLSPYATIQIDEDAPGRPSTRVQANETQAVRGKAALVRLRDGPAIPSSNEVTYPRIRR